MDQSKNHSNSVKMVNHYISYHWILLVGEGDFSFALCLARSFDSAINIVATSLDSYDTVINKHKQAKSNIKELRRLGVFVIHMVDAENMKFHPNLMNLKFDRIIYNFPHAGFYGKEDNIEMIRMHQKLVNGFFHNASWMLRADGEIHVTHKTSPPFDLWDLQGLAHGNSLVLVECVEFRINDYKGYNNKRGDGFRCDDPFPLRKSSTFKFAYCSTLAKELIRQKETSLFAHRLPYVNQLPPAVVPFNKLSPGKPNSIHQYTPAFVPSHESARHPVVIHHTYRPNPNYDTGVGFSTRMGISPSAQCDVLAGRKMPFRLFDGSIDHVQKTFGRSDVNVAYDVQCEDRRRLQHLVSLYGAKN